MHISGKRCCLSSLGHLYLGKLSSPFSSDTRYRVFVNDSLLYGTQHFLSYLFTYHKNAYQRWLFKLPSVCTIISVVCISTSEYKHTWTNKYNKRPSLVYSLVCAVACIRSKPHAKHFDNTVVAFYIVNYKLLQLLCVCIEQKRHSVVDVRPAPWGAPLLPLHHLPAVQPRSPPVYGYRFSVLLAWIWTT